MAVEKCQKSRKEIAEFLAVLLEKGPACATKSGWHFGKVDLRELMDFMFEGPPTNPDEFIK